jgi:acetyl/propionyl-CoA carboxylase alpha subunit
VGQGDRVDARFDSLLAKLVVWGPDRAAAAARLSAALADFTILGCATNLPLLRAIGRDPDFLAGRLSTDWIRDHLARLNAPLLPGPCLALLASPAFREALDRALRGQGRPLPGPAERFMALDHPELKSGGRGQPAFALRPEGEGRFTLGGPALDRPLALTVCRLAGGALALAAGGESLVLEDPAARPAAPGEPAGPGPVLAPMAGKVLEVRVAPGEAVAPGQLLFVLESMKMQFEVTAPRAGRVASVLVAEGQVLRARGPWRCWGPDYIPSQRPRYSQQARVVVSRARAWGTSSCSWNARARPVRSAPRGVQARPARAARAMARGRWEALLTRATRRQP